MAKQILNAIAPLSSLSPHFLPISHEACLVLSCIYSKSCLQLYSAASVLCKQLTTELSKPGGKDVELYAVCHHYKPDSYSRMCLHAGGALVLWPQAISSLTDLVIKSAANPIYMVIIFSIFPSFYKQAFHFQKAFNFFLASMGPGSADILACVWENAYHVWNLAMRMLASVGPNS